MGAKTLGLTTSPCGRDNNVEVGVVDGGSLLSADNNAPLVDKNPESPFVNRYVEVSKTSSGLGVSPHSDAFLNTVGRGAGVGEGVDKVHLPSLPVL